jgi:hypothetical protein
MIIIFFRFFPYIKIVLRNGKDKIDGFFFSKFEGLNEICENAFTKYFMNS